MIKDRPKNKKLKKVAKGTIKILSSPSKRAGGKA